MKYASVVAPLLIAVSAEAMNSGRAGTVPECVAHRGSVWAMCGSKEVGKWGVGTEGTEQAIVNCNSAAVHSNKLGKCPETIPRCMAHKGSVWAMCGSKEAGKWGVGTEGTEQAIKNCDWTAVHRNKFGKCPDPAVAPCLHTTCAMVDGRMIVNNRAHNLPGRHRALLHLPAKPRSCALLLECCASRRPACVTSCAHTNTFCSREQAATLPRMTTLWRARSGRRWSTRTACSTTAHRWAARTPSHAISCSRRQADLPFFPLLEPTHPPRLVALCAPIGSAASATATLMGPSAFTTQAQSRTGYCDRATAVGACSVCCLIAHNCSAPLTSMHLFFIRACLPWPMAGVTGVLGHRVRPIQGTRNALARRTARAAATRRFRAAWARRARARTTNRGRARAMRI